MTLASTSSNTVLAIKESTFGTTPVTGNPITLRVTGESLAFAITKQASNEINASRVTSSMVPTTASASGGIQSEMHYAGLDPLIEATLQSTWTVFGTNGVGAAVTCAFATGTITASVAPTGANAFTNLQLGQWFRVTSAGDNNGKFFKVHSSTAPTSTVITLDAGTPGVASASESCQIQTSRLTHGATMTSWTLERQTSDISVFSAFRGMTPSKMDLSLASGSLTTASFEFMGKDKVEGATTFMPGTPVVPVAYDVHSGVGGAINAIWLDGAPITGTYVKSVTLNFDNSLRAQEAIGTLGAVGIGNGTINCTLQMQVYFADSSLFNKFKNNSNTAVIFSSVDAAGNGYFFTVPKANMSDYKSNAGGKDQDMMLDLSFTALADTGNAVAALRKLLFIDRVGAAVA